MSTEKKPYVVFTWKLANELNERGFAPIGKRLNFKDPTQEVILFDDTPELRQAIKDIQKG
jgi:hypothetical protein